MIVGGTMTSVFADNHIPLWQVSSPRIQAVYWTTDGEYVQWPVIALDPDSHITLNFDILDDIDNNSPWLQAKLQHVDKNWNPEPITTSQYVKGFNYADIGFGEPSINGITTLYRHYELDFPNGQLIPTVSGNYILSLYDNANPDSILVQVPLLIQDNKANLTGNVSPVTDISYKKGDQQVSVTADISQINNPLLLPNDFTLVIGQNFSPFQWREVGFPTSLAPGTLNYNHNRNLIFNAGNNFRRMEVISNEIPMMNVERIRWIDPYYHHFLATDFSRADNRYILDLNNHGKFVVREYNTDEPEIGADYCLVHFTLDGTDIPPNSRIYIDADFTGRRLDSSSQLLWDPSRNIYYKTLMLKQGAYSYQYYSPDPNLEIEGNFYQTENIYPTALYYRLPGERFDRLATTLIIND